MAFSNIGDQSLVRAAVVAWKLKEIRSDGDFFAHFFNLVSIAHEEGAHMVVFPENLSLELLDLAPDIEEEDVPAFMIQFSAELEGWITRISRSSGMIIIGGSHLRASEGGIKNVCAVGHPQDGLTLVEKNNLTTYEKDIWRLLPGKSIASLADSRLGALICYDSEFPEASRMLAEDGVTVLCVPAFTESQRGFQRVRWSCQARAIENQIFVLHSSLVGNLGREPVPSTVGTSAILVPSTEPFIESAVLGETKHGEEEVIVRNLDLEMLAQARSNGDVRNWSDRHQSNWSRPLLHAEDETA